jgi:hypothetical protein
MVEFCKTIDQGISEYDFLSRAAQLEKTLKDWIYQTISTIVGTCAGSKCPPDANTQGYSRAECPYRMIAEELVTRPEPLQGDPRP